MKRKDVKTLKKRKRKRVPSIKTKCGYIPKKYFGTRLTKKETKARIEQICKGKALKSDDPAAYKKWKTDYNAKTLKKKKTKTSSYNMIFYRLYPELKGAKGDYFKLREEKIGFPARLLKVAYRKGVAAWRTGHRPGATPEQWGYARVSSLLVKGKTFTGSGKRPVGSDYHLYKEALETINEEQKRKLKTHYRKVDKYYSS